MKEREAEHEQRKSRERGRHRIWSRLWAVGTEPNAGLAPTNCEIMTWAEVRRLTNWATQVPLKYFIFKWLKKGFFNVYFWEREIECECGRCSERGRHRIWSTFQALSCQHRAHPGGWTQELWDHDLCQSSMPKPNQLSHSGGPKQIIFKKEAYSELYL